MVSPVRVGVVGAGQLARMMIPAAIELGVDLRVLAEGEGWSISGLVGRIWTLSRDYPPLEGPDQFRAWDTRGTVKVLFAHWVEDDGDGGATFFSEARVDPTDRWAAMRLKAIWAALGKFERLIGAEPLSVAVRRASDRDSVSHAGG